MPACASQSYVGKFCCRLVEKSRAALNSETAHLEKPDYGLEECDGLEFWVSLNSGGSQIACFTSAPSALPSGKHSGLRVLKGRENTIRLSFNEDIPHACTMLGPFVLKENQAYANDSLHVEKLTAQSSSLSPFMLTQYYMNGFVKKSKVAAKSLHYP